MTVRFRKWPKQSGKTGGSWRWDFTVGNVRHRARARNPDNRLEKAQTRSQAELFETIAYQRAVRGEPIFRQPDRREADRPQGCSDASEIWTFERFVEKKYRPIAKSNHRHYNDGARYCLTILLEAFGPKLITEIRPSDIETFKRAQAARTRTKTRSGCADTISPKTVNLYLDCLSSVFTLAIAEKLMADNPCDSVMRLEVEPTEKHVLSRDEEARLLDACKWRLGAFDRTHVKHAIVILVEGGFRPEEFLTMKKSQVDLEKRQVTVISYKRGRRRRASAQPKRRIVPISYRAMPHYEALIRTEGEKLYPFTTLQRVWRAVRREAGLPGFWLRWLRDTAKARWEEAGFGAFEIALLLGHSSPQQTMTYSHLDHQRALALMNRSAPQVEQTPVERTATAVQLYQL